MSMGISKMILSFIGIYQYVLCIYSSIGQTDSVIEYDDDNFKTEIAKHTLALIMFSAPGTQCNDLKPMLTEVASQLQDIDPPVAIAQVNCFENGKKTCNKYQVEDFPALKLFRIGMFAKNYEGTKDTKSIIQYLKSERKPSSKECRRKKDIDEFFNSNNSNAKVMGFWRTGVFNIEEYLKVTQKLRDKILFGHTSVEHFFELYDVNNTFIFIRPKYLNNIFENNTVKYEGDLTTENMLKFILEHFHGMVGHRTLENMDDFSLPLIIAYYDIDYKMKEKQTNYWRNRILQAAKDFTSTFNFAMSSTKEFYRELEEYQINRETHNKPLIFAKITPKKKYLMTDNFTMDNFNKFLKNVKVGTLQPHRRSYPIDEQPQEGVVIATGDTFERLVINNEKDTMVLKADPNYYEEMYTTFKKLAKRMEKDNIVFVIVDGLMNDLPEGYDDDELPVIYWAPKNKKNKPDIYSGEETKKDIIRFIAKHATNELINYDRNGKRKKSETSKKTEL